MTSMTQQQPSLAWEDLEPGFRYETFRRTITEADIVNFAAYSGDYNSAHVDAEYARGSPWGQRIAHGMLVASVMSGLNTQAASYQQLAPSLLGLLEVNLKWPNPTYIGDTIGVIAEVIERRTTSKPGRGIVVFRRTAINQRGEVICESIATMMIASREKA